MLYIWYCVCVYVCVYLDMYTYIPWEQEEKVKESSGAITR